MPYQGKSDSFMQQYMQDDRAFEEAHNAMINRLNYYQSLPLKDKIQWAPDTVTTFDKIY